MGGRSHWHGLARWFRWKSLVSWFIVFALWYLVTRGGHPIVDPLFLSSPWRTFVALFDGIRYGGLLVGFCVTFGRALAGFLFACLVGVPLGLLLGGVAIVEESVGGLIDALRSMPATALYPVFMFALGSGSLSKIAVAAFVCIWAITIYTAYGVTDTGKTRRFLLRMHGVRGIAYLFDGLIFPAMPAILGGMRTAVSLAVVLTIGVEMIVGTTTGLGQSIFDAQNTYRIPEMYAAILAAAAGGFALNKGFKHFAKWLTPWNERGAGVV